MKRVYLMVEGQTEDNAIKLAVGHLEKTTNHANFRESIREDSRDS